MPNLVIVALIVLEKNGIVHFLPFDLDLFTLTFSQSLSVKCGLKRLVTKYDCTKFGDHELDGF